MASDPSDGRVVVIGAGIVGNSLVHHLARLGWRDIVQIDQGPLPNGRLDRPCVELHFPFDHSREITDLTLDSVRAVPGDRRLHGVRRFEIAHTEERMRSCGADSSARAWGIRPSCLPIRQGEGPVHRDRPVHRRF